MNHLKNIIISFEVSKITEHFKIRLKKKRKKEPRKTPITRI